MKITFENETERSNVARTLKRLIETIDERSHSTAEVRNLTKAMFLVEHTECAQIREYSN